MRLLLILSFILLVACDPYGFGFKKNPAFLLDESLKAVNALDHKKLLEFTSREAKCIYANEEGVAYLHEKISITNKTSTAVHVKGRTKYFRLPELKDFWTYYSEHHLLQITDKRTDEAVVDVLFECNYGTTGDRNTKLINLAPSIYKAKACSIIKIIPKNFEALPLPEKCDILKVDVEI